MESTSKKSGKPTWIKDVIQLVVIVALLLGARVFLFSPISIKGDSMYPTLKDGDKGWTVKIAPVNRFDIVKLHAPAKAVEQVPEEAGKDFIKRVIGMPGDNIEVKSDQLYINGEKYKEPYLTPGKEDLAPGEQLTDDFSMEKDLGVQKIPEGKYLVMGDNRPVSYDSRRFGLVDKEDIVGVFKLRYWPLKQFGTVK